MRQIGPKKKQAGQSFQIHLRGKSRTHRAVMNLGAVTTNPFVVCMFLNSFYAIALASDGHSRISTTEPLTRKL